MVMFKKELSKGSKRLNSLLLDICPRCEKITTRRGRILWKESKQGEKSLQGLAHFLGMTTWGVSKWVHAGKIPANKVNRLIEIADGRVAQKKLFPFVFTDSA